MIFNFREVGKAATGYARIEADNIDEALNKFGGVDEVISPYSRFKKHYFEGIFEVIPEGEVNSIRVIHSSRVLNGYGYHGGGRPAMAPENKKKFVTVSISGTPEEISELKEKAKQDGKTVSRFVLENIL